MKIFRFIISIALIFIIIFSFTFCLAKISKKQKYEIGKEYKGIITIWHVDSFEGGKGSRRQFLMEIARDFEKQNDGILIMVTNETSESINEKIKNEENADIISFGMGITLPKIVEIESDYSFDSGKINGVQYAIPWCRGSYVLITNNDIKEGAKNTTSLVISSKEYCNYCTAGVLENLAKKDYIIKEPLEAYIQFASGKVYSFWGTQRDIIRLNNRNFNFDVVAMQNYNDLYQYFSLTKSGKEKGYPEKFINYVLSEKVQKKLNKIGMFSPYINVEYQEENMAKIQLAKYKEIPSAFTSLKNIKKMQQISTDILDGKENDLLKLKNLIV